MSETSRNEQPNKKQPERRPAPEWLLRQVEEAKKENIPDWLKKDIAKKEAEQRSKLTEGLNEQMEKEMIDKVLKEAGIAVSARLNARTYKKYQESEEFYLFTHRSSGKAKSGTLEGGYAYRQRNEQFGGPYVSAYRYRKNNFKELIDIRHLKKSEPELVAPGKKGFLGIGKTEAVYKDNYVTKLHSEAVDGGTDEPAVLFSYVVTGAEDYCTNNINKGGKSLCAEFTLPESTAKEFEKTIDGDPTVMRRLVGRALQEKLLKDPKDWIIADGDDVMRPNWDRWDAEPGGTRMYIQKEGGETGFHEKNIRVIKSKK